ncbi:hypothetical protein [Microscilla marina]|uniref:Uncharacterized protein n=1 Tax=Microscilla marina ATCC 23134 TaxID=313606 RepID=A1ZFI3_MICM2|nr:hypothetical protein [Microscilla marina]EAY30757.1 hypothetical protein M23134_01081 [Microscilla marina ATCC 23134]
MHSSQKTTHYLSKQFFLTSVLTCLCAFGVQAQHGKITEGKDPFTKMNSFFRKSYAKTRQKLIEQHAPVIAFVNGGLLFVRKGAKPRWENITPALYTELKTVSHVPLALYVILGLEKEGILSTGKLQELKDFMGLMTAARKTLKKRSFVNTQQLQDQFTQIDLGLALADKCLRTNKLIHSELQEFLKKSQPLIQRNVLAAIAAQIDVAHTFTKEFYSTLDNQEKKQLMVLVSGPKAARKDHAITQYFAKALNVKGEGARILYTESVFSRKGVLNILGTFLLDTQVGISFFNDKWRMHRDLLSDAGRYYISTLSFEDFR